MEDAFIIILVLGSSALAIGLLVVLNLVVGGWQPARLADERAAAEALANGVFGFEGGEIVLDADGSAALALERDGNRLGLVVCRGDSFVVRALRPGELGEVHRDGGVLSLTLKDFTLTQARLRFRDDVIARQWEERASLYTGGTAPWREKEGHPA